MQIARDIERLIQYGLEKQLITSWDWSLTRNKILDVLDLKGIEPVEVEKEWQASPVDILSNILNWAAEHDRLPDNTVTERDLLDTKLMGCLVPSQTEVIRQFQEIMKKDGPKQATADFYRFSKDVNYIRTDRIAKNEQWLTPTDYGEIEITINLSKPEKDPKAIAAAKGSQLDIQYPQCVLCKENVGYTGRLDHPARQNHRIIPVTLQGEQWYLQYSPYVYYNEHCIVLKEDHVPMDINKATFDRLLAFVETYPHYFLGSNADLPIVGGSVLSHDHFQGGHHEFPMAKAGMDEPIEFPNFPNVKAGIVKWPMSVIRLQSEDPDTLSDLAGMIFDAWVRYSDPSVSIYASTNGERHNTITPIARRRGDWFELDLVLRNNRTSEAHPLGIFHPHANVHHIKKENIGLIEVMGLAVLPGRLKEELEQLGRFLADDVNDAPSPDDERIHKHLDWGRQIKTKYSEVKSSNVNAILEQEIGQVFATILEHAGVFKRDEEGQQAFRRFISTVK
ncbi:UDP-glucose--hexose-1-phosphate uridylyltransferase [Tuberibacillus sp. Marseille-P3662]|uniref:UDP-glucose--hexose-1-phosphate uridylyltransferase n=1 Tax=Tuberibacillus sp. Marseille-P3662 TaxID=1965358 RepID=UPI003F91303C